MAETPDDALVKKEPAAPAADPITSRTTSSILLLCMLLLMGSLAWALYDEVYGQRPWKNYQQEFVSRYNRYLRRLKVRAGKTDKEVRESPEYQKLDSDARDAMMAVEPQKRQIDERMKAIDDEVAAITTEFQNGRARITAINYEIEQAGSEDDKKELREKRDRARQAR